MGLPLTPPLKPQLALARRELPVGEEYLYEIKLDGFRCLAFVDGEEVFLQSRNGRPLGRYFPELRFPAGRYVLDGEIVVRGADGREDFDALGPAHPSRRLAHQTPRGETPAVYVAFDLLARDEDALLERPFGERRAALREPARRAGPSTAAPIELMPTVDTVGEAQRWLREAEGAMAKERSAPYCPGLRKGTFKVKRVRTIDAVLVGWRPGKEADTVGALILGLYDGPELRVVGHCSGLTPPRSAVWSASLPPTRRASAAPPTPAAGAPGATSSGSRCAPSSSSRSTSTTSPPGASATAPSCAAGAMTRIPGSAPSSSSSPDRARPLWADRPRRHCAFEVGSVHSWHMTALPWGRRSTSRSSSGCRRPGCR